MRRLAALLASLAFVGLLAGCYTAGNNSSLSAPIPGPVPTGLATTAAGSVPGCAVGGSQVAVDLPTVLRLAGGRNLDVRMIREGMREAHAKMVHAGQWLLPTVKPGVRFNNINGDVQGTDGSIVDVDKENAFVGARIVMEWEIGEGIYNALAAQRRADARRADLQAGFNDAALVAAEAYMDLLQAQGESVVADASCVLYATFVEETTAQAAVGGGFRGDILAAKARQAHAKVLQAKAREHVQIAAVRLREILDLPSHVTLVAAEPQPAPLALIDPNCDERGLIAEALAARPEIRSARGDSRAALADHDKTTTGVLFPDVRVGYDGGLFGDGFDDLDGTSRLGVGLEWKIGRGGIGDSSRQAATASRVRRSRLRVQQVRQVIVREVSASKAALEARQIAMSHAQSGASDAAEALGLYRERQELGVGLPLEAILAEESLTRARLDQVQAIIGFNKAQLRLLRALGRR